MADLSEVSDALRDLCQSIIYPDGTSNPSVINSDVKIYSGWPIPKTLDEDVIAGISHISIFSEGKERNTTRFLQNYDYLPAEIPTIVLEVDDNAVEILGINTPSVSQWCTLIVNGTTYTYTVQPTDTLNQIAINLAALIPSATAFSTTITIPGAYKIIARVGTNADVQYETKRQERCFEIHVWAPDYTKRDALSKYLDTFLPQRYHFELSDQWAKLTYSGSHQIDNCEKTILYRRIMYYNVEYGTNFRVNAPVITSTEVNVNNEFRGYIMNIESLVVCKPFKDYRKGQKICDSEKIKEILESDNKNFVVKTVKVLKESEKKYINKGNGKTFK